MTESIPLLAYRDVSTVAYVRGAPIDVTHVRNAAVRLAARLPAAGYVVNLCTNRYYFLVAWLAACLREQVLLLPPEHSAGTLDELTKDYPDQHTLDDQRVEALLDADETRAPVREWFVAADRVVAIAFTSGSTGRPQAHPKRWGALSQNAKLAAEQVLGGAGVHVVATVPPQHMYGLETSVISALSAGCVLFEERPFFPADLQAALESVPEPRTLVTTPTHLHALQSADVRLPRLRAIVSATAPLQRELAQALEERWSTTLHEIYGCTEAGIVAWRRTSVSELWRTFKGGRIGSGSEGAWYEAPQLPERVSLQDAIELLSDTEFYLRGRADDMIKVAGKRTSLNGLTQQLRSTAGVLDAVVFLPAPDARPAALVVAPGLTAQKIASALSERVDPVFVPRPLLCVAQLPRNALGKLPHEALLRAIAAGESP